MPTYPTAQAWFRALSHICQTSLAQRWDQTQEADRQAVGVDGVRCVHYLSMEFLMGRALSNALAALGADAAARERLAQAGQSLSDVLETENDAALGNGGLGRLAACFMDAFAQRGLPSFGYGLRYQFGMFLQTIQDGQQVETPDHWMRNGNPWEFQRPDISYRVGFGGLVQEHGGQTTWIPAEVLLAQAYDFVVPAHTSARVSTLRQWHAAPEVAIDFAAFCRGDYQAADARRLSADTLNWVLYPDDSTPAGRELRLKQEAFLVSASMQDIVARHLAGGHSLHTLGRTHAVHLNDTHPALAPAELMRLLVDEHGMAWDAAWVVTREMVSYTNHTLMPEALETWPLPLFSALLPRHLAIIEKIDRQFLDEVRARFPDDPALVARVSLFDESNERRLRMASLAIVASHKVNGVSVLHSELMVQTIFLDYAKIFPQRFHNVTNGITPRRWLAQANPALAKLLDRYIGTLWRADLGALSGLGRFACERGFVAEFWAGKRANKVHLAGHIARLCGIRVDPDSMFDVQTKRIHEYKRQLLNILQVIARYQAILDRPGAQWTHRTVVIAGKAASSYRAAKCIIALAHDVARVVNNDSRIGARLKLVFLPNYGVSLAEAIIPAADLSEQISTAGTEASGTGNMKFALNGALTIGTWDGANIEMAQAMGAENMFVFGLRTQQIQQLKQAGYQPRDHVMQSPALQRVLGALLAGHFSAGDRHRYKDLVHSLLEQDPYFLMADFDAYLQAQTAADALFQTPQAWAGRAILNVAAMGSFSADRTVDEYVQRVWMRQPAPGAGN